ncbi:DUF2971 domain-containing protein [Clostridium estertheticum]|uniref:DUF2971 domain-containing protein n=1 Tax=Clostridium estertheticum TaxID=238834 RepID=UPI0013EE5A39|nr:DUF2971 domain-containing protein [Clostridium estertheticum]MBZ9609952.1 DUF2971 domain-containing protein [Clostridium estertheticum]
MPVGFDIKKYRAETPMDYLKAIKLINEDPHNGEVMNAIYRVTRLHIPDLVFKYYTLSDDTQLNEVRFKTLLDKKIYLADASSFNDPYDSKAFFYNNKEFLKYDWLKQFNGKLIDDFSSYNRLCSFTSVGINNMPMWAHYANNHCGYCVEYNTKQKENLKLSSCFFPVQYIDERVNITPIMKSVIEELDQLKNSAKKNNVKKIAFSNIILAWVIIYIYYSCLKHSSWSYEKELRCVVAARSLNMPYVDAVPTTIYIGAKCSELNKTRLIDISFKLDIPIYKMTFDEYSLDYKLIPVRIS